MMQTEAIRHYENGNWGLWLYHSPSGRYIVEMKGEYVHQFVDFGCLSDADAYFQRLKERLK